MEETGGVEECINACKMLKLFVLFWSVVKSDRRYGMCVFVFSGDSRSTDAVRGACKDVGSVSDIIFEMRFNPNVFSPGQLKKNSPSKTLSHVLTLITQPKSTRHCVIYYEYVQYF